jgi:hypothetical protein
MLSKLAAALAVTFSIGWGTATAVANGITQDTSKSHEQAVRICEARRINDTLDKMRCITDEMTK